MAELKPGDKVILNSGATRIKDGKGGYHKDGDVFTINSIVTKKGYDVKAALLDAPSNSLTLDDVDYKDVYAVWLTAVRLYIPAECICSKRQIAFFGCNCGFFAEEKRKKKEAALAAEKAKASSKPVPEKERKPLLTI